MAIRDIQLARGRVQLFQGKSGVPEEEEGPDWVRGTRQLLDKLLIPRDPRGIVLACGFVAVTALAISALVFGDPLGYAYLGAAAIGYFFLQTRLVPTALWLLISFGGAAGAIAGNTSDWIVCGFGLLLAGVSLLPVPATYRGEVPNPDVLEDEPRPLQTLGAGGSKNGAGSESSRNLEDRPEPSRILELGAAEGLAPPLNDGIHLGNQLAEPADPQIPSPAGTSRAARVSIKTMGRLHLEVSGRDLTRRLNEQPRLEFLFSYLLARTTRGADAAIDRPALADEVAPGISAASQRDRLRKQLYALQSTLGVEAKGLLRVSSTHVRLDLSWVDIDIGALEQVTRVVGRGKALIDAQLADQIRALLEESAGGEFLAGFSELEQQVTAGHGTASQIVEEARVLIAGWRADLVLMLAEYNEAAGHPQASIAYLKSALAQCPQREDLARLLVAAYLQTGQTARATEARLEYDLTKER